MTNAHLNGQTLRGLVGQFKMSKNTARRALIGFLIELDCISVETGVEYLFKVGAKTGFFKQTIEDYYFIYKNKLKS